MRRMEGLDMSLRIVAGRSGTGKSTFIHQEIIQQLKESPIGHPIFLIVPDQMSYTTEYALTNHYGVEGLMRAQVMTFKRLAWLVLQETGGIARKEINGFGYRMLIRQLLEANKEQFSLFRQAAGKRGFTEEIEALLKEFSRYSVNSELLTNVNEELEVVGAPHTLRSKTKDLQIVIEALEERLGTTYVDSEGYYPILTEKMQFSDTMQNATIYVDGFTAFTTREFELVGEMLKVSKRVTIVLPYEHEDEAKEEQALFHEPALTSVQLKELAHSLNIEIEQDVYFADTKKFNNTQLKHLESNFYLPVPEKTASNNHIEIIEATSRRAEVHAIAREILKLTKEENFRFNEVAILYRQADLYDPLIATIFPQYDIPVFMNTKKPMLHHPLIEFCRSVFEIILSNWKYEPIFRSIKTDLFFPFGGDLQAWRERGDRLENFVIAQGIYGERWFEESRWFYKKYRGLEFHTRIQTDEERAMQAEIEAVRDIVREPVRLFGERLQQAKTGRAIATTLFQCVEELQIYEKLQAMKNRELNKYDLLAAGEHDQAWRQWLDVLDQFVLMFGDQELTLEEAAKLLDEGFDTLEFSRIPPSIDEVIVATVDLARLSDKKAVFVIGVNDGVFPQRMDYEGLLSDTEREWFMQIGYMLAPTSRSRLMQEAFLTYRAFTSPSHKLYVTYPTADEESKALTVSLYVKKLQQMFEGLPISKVYIDPSEALSKVHSPLLYLRHPRTSLPYLMTQLRQVECFEELGSEWRALKRYYEEDLLWKMILQRVMKPLTHKNEAQPLLPHVTESLYGNQLTSSVSRIEKFFRCPFSHFATYGLHLEERAEYRLETFAMGDLFHEALKWIAEETARLNISWVRLTKQQCADLARQAVEQIVPVFSYQILQSSARYRYIQRKLIRIVERTMIALSQQAHLSHFKPLAIEASFGPGRDEKLPPIEIDLTSGKKMHLRGRIDRIDSAVIDDRAYIRVVDYKSSRRDLDLNEVYYGLSLQVLTYLDVAVENASIWLPNEAEPAGVLYVHVHNPMLQIASEVNSSELEQLRLKEYKMKGLLTENTEALFAMDEEIEGGGTSKIIPVMIKKDGTPSASMSKVVPVQDMVHLRQFVRYKHQQAGNGIVAGETAISPYRLKQKTACDYCNFKSVCQFDPTDMNQSYRQLTAATPNNIVEKIREELK